MLVKMRNSVRGIFIVVDNLRIRIAPNGVHDPKPVAAPDIADVLFAISATKQSIGQVEQRVRKLDLFGIVVKCSACTTLRADF